MSDPKKSNPRDDYDGGHVNADDLDAMFVDPESTIDPEAGRRLDNPEPGSTMDQRVNAAGNSETNSFEEQDQSAEFKAHHTSLKCLALIARHHSIDVSADRKSVV